MLTLHVKAKELLDERTMEFINIPSKVFKLEHSLLSLSKWETKWQKPFLSSTKSRKEFIDYIRCMTIPESNDEYWEWFIDDDEIRIVQEYIESPQSATVINQDALKGRKKNNRSRFITSELIYWWMICFNVPIEFEKWHLNRLMNLLEIAIIESNPPKKMSMQDIARQNQAINAKRLEEMSHRQKEV